MYCNASILTVLSEDDFSATFLLSHSCSTRSVLPDTRETALHLCTKFPRNSEKREPMAKVAELLLENEVDDNARDDNQK